MTGWGDNGESGGSDFFEKTKVTEKKVQRSQTSYSQCAIVLSIHHCPSFVILAVAGIQTRRSRDNTKGFGVSHYHFGGEAADFSSQNNETKSVLSGFAGLLVMSREA